MVQTIVTIEFFFEKYIQIKNNILESGLTHVRFVTMNNRILLTLVPNFLF